MKNKESYYYVAVTLVNNRGEVLAQHRDDNPLVAEPNTWGMCGGRQERNLDRTFFDTGRRELREETGYEVGIRDLKLLGGDEFWTYKGLVKRRFLWAPYDGIQPVGCFEGQEIRFLTRREVESFVFCDPYHRDYLFQATYAAKYRRRKRT